MRFHYFRPCYAFDAQSGELTQLKPAAAPNYAGGLLLLYAPNRNYWMFDHLLDRQLLFLEFSPDEWEDNRLNLPALCSKHKIWMLEEWGFVQVLLQKQLSGRISANCHIPVNSCCLYEGQKVYLYRGDDILLGPYPVEYQQNHSGCFIRITPDGDKGTWFGYVMENGVQPHLIEIDCGQGQEVRYLIRLPEGIKRICVDKIAQKLPQCDVDELPSLSAESRQTADALCAALQSARPVYDRNFIYNLFLCICQGGFTIVTGEPGVGKTSLCYHLAAALGLAQPTEDKRFVPVSVEHGWTCSQHWVGQIWDGLQMLHQEQAADKAEYPFLVLLDEANMSQIEQYWSVFMNFGDTDLPDARIVIPGVDQPLCLPNTLRFLATVNDDRTVYPLTPRLIDRSWIVHLPCLPSADGKQLPITVGKPVFWEALQQAFAPAQPVSGVPLDEMEEGYQRICALLQRGNLPVSPRCDRAVRRYWHAAVRLFEPDEADVPPVVLALDYAVVQRIVPRLAGRYLQAELLWQLCMELNLQKSAQRLDEMLRTGNFCTNQEI